MARKNNKGILRCDSYFVKVIHFHALMSRKSCAVGVRNAMLRNHLSSPTAYISCIQITRHFQFDPRKSTVTEKYT